MEGHVSAMKLHIETQLLQDACHCVHASTNSHAVGRDLSKLTHVRLAQVVHRNSLRPLAGHDVGRPSPCTHVGGMQVVLELLFRIASPPLDKENGPVVVIP